MFLCVFCMCFGVFLYYVGVFWGVAGVVFYSFFSRNSVICRFSKKLLKAWQAQCFSKWGYPGRREKKTKLGVGTPWKRDAHMHRFIWFFYDFRMPLGIILGVRGNQFCKFFR